jgi:hypothetical protein
VTTPARSTCALVRVDGHARIGSAVRANSTVQAWPRATFINVHGAILITCTADPAGRAGAGVEVNGISASRAVEARPRGTFVEVDSAVLVACAADPARRARAGVSIDEVVACASVLARGRCALVNVIRAIEAIPTRCAGARVRVDAVGAGGPVQTCVRGTFVNIKCTVLIADRVCPAGHAGARVQIDQIRACGAVQALCRRAFVYVDGAILVARGAHVASGAAAHVDVHRHSNTLTGAVRARGPVLALTGRTLVNINGTI